MSLPLSRNTTYSPDAPVKSTDMNDTQDSIVAAAHGAIGDVFHPFACALGANVSKNGAGYLAFSGIGDAHLAPKMTTGDRLTSVNLRVYGNAATTFAANVWVYGSGGVATNIGPGAAAVTATPAAAWTDLTVNVTDTTLGAGESLWISIETDGGGARLGNITLSNTHPL